MKKKIHPNNVAEKFKLKIGDFVETDGDCSSTNSPMYGKIIMIDNRYVIIRTRSNGDWTINQNNEDCYFKKGSYIDFLNNTAN